MPEFAQPAWFWALLLLPAVFLLRFRTAIGAGVAEGSFKRLAGSILRCLSIAALVIALAGPLSGSYSRHTDVVFVLDVSRSIARETVTEALAFINRSRVAKPANARMGLVVFANDAALEMQVQNDAEPLQELAAHVERDNTDIGRALEVAIGAFPPGQQRRIVLLSDGQENSGNARSVAAAARSLGVEIFTIPLQQSRQRNEVRMQNINTPQWVRVFEPFTVQMSLHSNEAASAHLIMMRNGSILRQAELNLTPGDNVFSLVDQVSRSGLYEYEAIVNSAQDATQENNRYQAFVQVRGEPRVLHVVGQDGWGWHVSAALRAQGLIVDEIPAIAMPANSHEFADYDLIILNNVSGFDLSLAKMERLEEYVRDSGGGLISLGGDNSYAAGGYYATPVERLLPVSMDLQSETRIPSLAVTIVLDKSGSMSSPSNGEKKLAIAKRAALAAIELLNALDRIGILAFDAQPEWSVPLTEAANRRAIADKLRLLQVGGGTDLFLALQEAYRVMAQQEAKIKHLIVLSDGLTKAEEDFAGLTETISAAGITISTVALGSDADQELMQAIATLGGGRFYYTNNPQNIPRIFTSETMVVSRDLVVEQDTYPILSYPGELLKGFAADAFPLLRGYQRTFAKPAAQVLLSAAGGDSADPLLVSWRYGLGKSVAFMSDMTTRWGQHWISWTEFTRFVTQLARWTMRHSGNEELRPSFTWQGQRGEIIIDALDRDERFINSLELQASIVNPEQASHNITLRQIAPGRYRGEFPVSHTGRYYINLSGSGENGAISPKTFGLAVPYSSEYLTVGVNEDLLDDLAAATGGRLLPLAGSAITAINTSTPGAISERWRIWWPWFLTALIFLMLEIAVRKINLPESWQQRWQTLWQQSHRQGPEDEPEYKQLSDNIVQVRQQYRKAQGKKYGFQEDDAAARARLYLASSAAKRR